MGFPLLLVCWITGWVFQVVISFFNRKINPRNQRSRVEIMSIDMFSDSFLAVLWYFSTELTVRGRNAVTSTVFWKEVGLRTQRWRCSRSPGSLLFGPAGRVGASSHWSGS